MHSHEEDEQSSHFRPDAWTVAWEATQDAEPPSCHVKASAERLVSAELGQQAIGWLLLTQIGVILGSFAQLMSQGVCLLIWAIFMLEAVLKFGRNWAHSRFFMDVPCAYVAIHQEAAHDSLAYFGLYLLSAAGLELALYVPFLVVVFEFWRQNRYCFDSESEIQARSPSSGGGNECQGVPSLIELLFICAATTVVHWVSSVATNWTFHSAIGVGIVFQEKTRRFKEKLSRHRSLCPSCDCKEVGRKGRSVFGAPRSDSDRLLCLTWWVHMARHRHLTAVVARAQAGNCGLPGHWFASVTQLRRIVEGSVVTGAGDHALTSEGPLWVSQEMALRAVVSLAKRATPEICREILKNEGLNLLVQVVREGRLSSCRGLAAAAIAVLASEHEIIQRDNVDFTVAVVPLKRLVRSREHELKEVALGALLNTALLNTVLTTEQFARVLDKFHCSDGIVGASSGTFVTVLMELAHMGPTTRCQELATGLLARLAGDSTQVRMALMEIGNSKASGLEMLIQLMQHGLTTEIKARAAGALAELAYKDGRALGRGPYGESCITALIDVLRCGPRVAFAAARALCNLAIKWQESKPRIVAAGGIEVFVELLDDRFPYNDEFMRRRDELPYKGSLSRMQEQSLAQAEAARALWMLALKNAMNQEHIAEARAIPLLADLLRNSVAKVHIQAVAALTALAWNNEKNQELIGREGDKIFPRIVRLLGNIGDVGMEEKVVEKVADAVKSFADGSKVNRNWLVNEGARSQLENIFERRGLNYRKKTLSKVKSAIDALG